jgi:hypothetical protein
MPMVYTELRRVARKHLARGVPGHTLESAALVNEAYLKLIRGHDIRFARKREARLENR